MPVQTFEAVIDENGNVRFIGDVQVRPHAKVYVVVPEEVTEADNVVQEPPQIFAVRIPHRGDAMLIRSPASPIPPRLPCSLRRWRKTMPKYDSDLSDPPIPVAIVELTHLVSLKKVGGIRMVIDTGADINIVPHSALSELAIEESEVASTGFGLSGFGGGGEEAKLVRLKLHFIGKTFTDNYAVADLPYGTVGRDVLNLLRIVFDGPRQVWEELKR
ncbi:MAG: hypothetical protein H7145_02470 [Akkermansiaceae bacterium]|nr:hypothetical protein [Armatimonadota bacterium]